MMSHGLREETLEEDQGELKEHKQGKRMLKMMGVGEKEREKGRSVANRGRKRDKVMMKGHDEHTHANTD